MADFAQMLKYFREREGLTQRELAEKLGMSAGAIGMYESGKRHPKFEDEETIADFFNVDLNTLRGKRIEEPNLDELAAAMKLYKTYAIAAPEIRSAIDSLLEVARTIQIPEIPGIENLKGIKPDTEFPHLPKDNDK